MKRITLIISLLALSFYSYGQYDMNLCKQIIETEVDFKNCKTASVITDVVGTSQIAANHFTFDSQSITFHYSEKHLKISDATGKFIYITYDNIKAITFSPETDRTYANFAIYLIN